jgi:predicted lipid-binding transport protein (Tim44 family)
VKLKHGLLALLASVALGFGLVAEAEAKRLGGGQSMGKQSGNVSQRNAPDRDAAPAGGANQAAPGNAAKPAPAAAPARQGNRWMGPLAGLAAGLGLAALASYMGFGEELASMMLIGLMVIAALVVVRMIMARRAAANAPRQPAYAGVSERSMNSGLGQEAMVPQAGSMIGSNVERTPVEVVRPAQPVGAREPRWHVPGDFDEAGFLRQAKVQFVRLQAAFDAANLDDLRDFTSPQMYAELKMQLQDRGEAANRTEVGELQASLLGIETTANMHMASVRFAGDLVEDGQAVKIDEVWNLSKPADGSGGWVLAGIQQLN